MVGYEPHVAKHCLTGSIRNHFLKIDKVILESDLVCCSNMLDTQYDIDLGGIYCPIKQIFDTASKEIGITLTEHISENQLDLLNSKIAAKDMIILHIDSRCLTYTPTFTTQLTVHSNHYVNIFDPDRNQYLISDSYIPTIPPSSHEGWIEIDDDYISKSVIFTMIPITLISIQQRCFVLGITWKEQKKAYIYT